MRVMAPDVPIAATSGLLRAAGQSLRAASDDLFTEDDNNYFRCTNRPPRNMRSRPRSASGFSFDGLFRFR